MRHRPLVFVALVVAACDGASGGALPPEAGAEDAGDAAIADASDAGDVMLVSPPPPSFAVGDGGVACYPGPTACGPCASGCTSLESATKTVSSIGSSCAAKTGGGGGCASLHLEVSAFGCAARFSVKGLAASPAFVACVEDALSALDFRCAAGATIDAAFEAGPCGGP